MEQQVGVFQDGRTRGDSLLLDFAHVGLHGSYIPIHLERTTLEDGGYDREEKGSNAMKLVWRNHMQNLRQRYPQTQNIVGCNYFRITNSNTYSRWQTHKEA